MIPWEYQTFQTVKTIGNILTSPKDPIAEHEKSRLVYKKPCADCEFLCMWGKRNKI